MNAHVTGEKSYLDVRYAESARPYTEYPDLLTRYLSEEFLAGYSGGRLLDLGCGERLRVAVADDTVAPCVPGNDIRVQWPTERTRRCVHLFGAGARTQSFGDVGVQSTDTRQIGVQQLVDAGHGPHTHADRSTGTDGVDS